VWGEINNLRNWSVYLCICASALFFFTNNPMAFIHIHAQAATAYRKVLSLAIKNADGISPTISLYVFIMSRLQYDAWQQ